MNLSEKEYLELFVTMYSNAKRTGTYTTKELISETVNNLGLVLDHFKVKVVKDSEKSFFTEDNYPQSLVPLALVKKVPVTTVEKVNGSAQSKESKAIRENKEKTVKVPRKAKAPTINKEATEKNKKGREKHDGASV